MFMRECMKKMIKMGCNPRLESGVYKSAAIFKVLIQKHVITLPLSEKFINIL